jgi:ketopantoate reductase
MNKQLALIGAGEMGGVFARGLLRHGYTVIPVTRDGSMEQVSEDYPDIDAVLVAVAEKDLHAVLEDVPAVWRDRLILLQNELLPRDWLQHELHNPTVISVWFEKKKGQDAKVIVPSPAYGPHAQLLHDALAHLDIPVRVLASEEELLDELVLKNLYILTTNVSGLRVGGTVGELWQQHQELATAVASDVLAIQESLTGKTFDHEKLISGMVHCFNGDLDHKCMGRSAPARLQRALEQADEASIEAPTLRSIAAEQS